MSVKLPESSRDRAIYVLYGVTSLLAIALVVTFLIAISARSDAQHAKQGKRENAGALATANSKLVQAGQPPVSTPAPAGPAPSVSLSPAPVLVKDFSLDGGEMKVTYTNGDIRSFGRVAGAPGSPGPSGSPGKSGPAGEPGKSGSPGPAGSAGSPGVSGNPGPAGSPGTSGSPGEPGPSGPTGPAGSDVPGPAGPSGPPGADGKDGKDGAAAPTITSITMDSYSHLIVGFSDGSSMDAGLLKQVDRIYQQDGHLKVRYSDGTVDDTGPIPTGPICPNGYTPRTRTAPDLSGDTWSVCVKD